MTELRNPELEAAILRDPLDRDAYRVYGDWLEGHGDPRAELIAVQCGETQPSRKVDEAVRSILFTHRETLLGPLKRWSEKFFWRYGFIHAARFDTRQGDLADMIETLVRHPSGRFVADLSLSHDGYYFRRPRAAASTEAMGKIPAAIERLVAMAPPLRELQVFSTEGVETPAGALWSAFSQLQYILLDGAFDLGAIDLPEATGAELRVVNGTNASAIVTAPWPKLEKLGLRCPQTTATMTDLVPLFARTDLTSLMQLSLTDAPFADEVCELLGGAPFASQLRHLFIRGSRLTDAGAHALAAAAPAMPNLVYLDISGARLSAAGFDAIEGMGIAKLTSDRYASTHE